LTPPVQLGTLSVPPIGVGTLNLDPAESVEVLKAAQDTGLSFIDTAERYGGGKGETLTRMAIDQVSGASDSANTFLVATKVAPAPLRLTPESVVEACDESRQRLRVDSIPLYQLHFPDPITLPGQQIQPLWQLPARAAGVEDRKNEVYWDGLAECYLRGLVKNVGVSNYGPSLLAEAHEHLAKRGVPLVSNQISLSLMNHRGSAGTVRACRELGVRVIACYPLANGALAGKYNPNDHTTLSPTDGFKFKMRFMRKLLKGGSPVVDAVRDVAERRGKTCAQVALNWCVTAQGAVAIAGARTPAHVAENAGALGWSLTESEAAELEAASALSNEFVTARMHLLGD